MENPCDKCEYLEDCAHYMKGDTCRENLRYLGYQEGYADGFKAGQGDRP